MTHRLLIACVAVGSTLVGCSDDTSSNGSAGASAAGGHAGSSGTSGGGTAGTGGAASKSALGFFVTSVGSGALGGNLGGLSGADATCQALAAAVGAGDRTWHAYLSTSTEHARDRIGTGPWQNSAGDVVAADVAGLHADGLSNADPQHVLDELGNVVPGLEHDIITGSLEDGTVAAGQTCLDWTSDSAGDVAQVGHSDLPPMPFSPSWNAAHESASCTVMGLAERLGSGRMYCFAID